MHRLDVGTTGVMVVAKSERAYWALKQQFLPQAAPARPLRRRRHKEAGHA